MKEGPNPVPGSGDGSGGRRIVQRGLLGWRWLLRPEYTAGEGGLNVRCKEWWNPRARKACGLMARVVNHRWDHGEREKFQKAFERKILFGTPMPWETESS